MLHGFRASALVLLLACLLNGSVQSSSASFRPEAFAPRNASILRVGVSQSQPGLDRAVSTGLNPSPYPRWWTASPPGIAAYGSSAIAALLLLLFVYRRHHYILQWMFSWVLRAVSLFAVSIEYASESIRLGMLGFSHFLSIASALLLVMSADTYRRAVIDSRQIRPGHAALADLVHTRAARRGAQSRCRARISHLGRDTGHRRCHVPRGATRKVSRRRARGFHVGAAQQHSHVDRALDVTRRPDHPSPARAAGPERTAVLVQCARHASARL